MTAVINCYYNVGRVDLGISMLGSYFKRGVVPNVITFGTILRGFFLEGRISQAQELLKKIIHEKLCQPNAVMFGIVVNGLCKGGNTALAIEFLRVMENGDCKPDDVIYNTIIDSLCKDKTVDKALSFLLEMIENGIVPNVVTYSCLVHGLCNMGRWEDVNTYTIMIAGLFQQGLVKEAKELFKNMEESGCLADSIFFNVIAQVLIKKGEYDETEMFLEE